MANIFKSQKTKSLMPFFLLAVAIILAYKIISELSFFVGILGQIWGILTPFFYGFILAYIINIPCGSIERLLENSKSRFIVKKKRGFSVVIVALIFAMVLALILNLIVPAVSGSVSHFIEHFPIYYENTLTFVEYINSLEILGLYISIDAIVSLFSDMIQNLGFDQVTSSLSALISVSTSIFRGFLAVIASVYFLIEKDKIQGYFKKRLIALMPADGYAITVGCVNKIDKNVRQYINTQTIDGCILGAMATIALVIMGSPFALVLGIMLGIVNYIPYFGSIFGTLVAVLIVAFTQGITSALIAAVVLLIIQQIDCNIIQPKLMSGSFSLSPLLVIVSISFGGAAAGLLGMIIAIPIVAFLKDIVDSIIAYSEHKKADRKEAEGSSV